MLPPEVLDRLGSQHTPPEGNGPYRDRTVLVARGDVLFPVSVIRLIRGGSFSDSVQSLSGLDQLSQFDHVPVRHSLLSALGADLLTDDNRKVAEWIAPSVGLLPRESAILFSLLPGSMTGVILEETAKFGRVVSSGETCVKSHTDISLLRRDPDSVDVAAKVKSDYVQAGSRDIATITHSMALYPDNPVVAVIDVLSEELRGKVVDREVKPSSGSKPELNPDDYTGTRPYSPTPGDNYEIARDGDRQKVHNSWGEAGRTVLGQFAPELRDDTVLLGYGVGTTGFSVISVAEHLVRGQVIDPEKYDLSGLSFKLRRVIPIRRENSSIVRPFYRIATEGLVSMAQVLVLRGENGKVPQHIRDGKIAAEGTITFIQK